MPTSFVFGDTFFVHGGIPRDATFESKWRGLAALNDPDLAFEMLWSNPGDVMSSRASFRKRWPASASGGGSSSAS
jgi:hypothetical protein